MPILTRFRQFFRKPAPSPAQPVPPEPAIRTQSEPMARVPDEQPISPVGTGPEAEPAWLGDEDLLRDEGVLFGLSDARPDEMISLIRHEFIKQTAELEQTIDRQTEKIGELNLFIDQHENRISELRHKADELALRKPIAHQLPRTLAGLTLSAVMCVGTFFLIDETLRPAFTESRWIAVGVFSAGMFSLFSRTSLFHEADAPVTARRLLEEAGLPLAASFFIFAQALKTQPLGYAFALLVFVFFLFLLAGKLLLGNLTVAWSDLHAISHNRRLIHEQLSKTADLASKTGGYESEIGQFRVQKWQIIAELNRSQAALTRLNARRDGLVKLFESEFNLARSLRDRLTAEQRQAILTR